VKKADLITAMSEKAGLTKQSAEKALTAFMDSVRSALQSGEKVTIPGFGSFSVVERSARTGRNPVSGEPVNIKASHSPKFKAGKLLKDAVND